MIYYMSIEKIVEILKDKELIKEANFKKEKINYKKVLFSHMGFINIHPNFNSIIIKIY